MTAAAEMGDTAALALAGAVTSGAGSLSGLGASREAGRAEPSQTHSARQVAPAEAGLVVVGPLPDASGGRGLCQGPESSCSDSSVRSLRRGGFG